MKAFSDIDEIVLGKVMLPSFVHPSKALADIPVIAVNLGNTRLVQPEKTDVLMTFTLVGQVTDVRDLQFMNALFSMVFIRVDRLKSILCTELPMKALSPTRVRDEGRVILASCVHP